MAVDPFSQDPLDRRASLVSPIEGGQAVVKSDTENLDQRNRLMYIGTGGTLVVVMRDGSELTFQNIAGGTWFPGRFKNVKLVSTVDNVNVMW